MRFDKRVVTTSNFLFELQRQIVEVEKIAEAMRQQLTGVKGDFADHNPSRSEAESQFDELADPVVQLDCDISRLLEDFVLHVGIHDGITRVVPAADAEHDADLGEYLKRNKKKKTKVSH